MAAPSTPQNYFIQQGNGDVLLSWDITATATGYPVQRSTDGVSFSTIATATVNNYTDTTATVNTMYYYKVAASNMDGTSAYTAAQQVVPTLTGKISLYELRQRSQQKADRVNSQFVTLPEWNFFINLSIKELYDLLITAYEDYFIAPRLVFDTDGSDSYDLPNGANYNGAPAFYKVYGVDLGLNSSQQAWLTMKKFNFIDRNRYVYPQLTSTILGVWNLAYRVMGDKIFFIPTPSALQNIGLWYFPRKDNLLQETDVLDGFSGWESYVICRAAKYALDKEESDTSKIDAEILYMKERIEETSQNRDAGMGDTISNTRSRSNTWGWGGANGYGGPNGGN
jgi:hypothetical protein